MKLHQHGPVFVLDRHGGASLAERNPLRGAIFVWVAIVLLVTIGFIGLALDASHVLTAKQQLQSAADAAALAAVAEVTTDPTAGSGTTPYSVTRNAAIQIAAQNDAAKSPVQLVPNYPNAAGGDIVVGQWDSTTNVFTPDTTAPNAVQVTARRSGAGGGGPLDLIWGKAFNKQSVDLLRSAVATLGAGDDAVILILDPTGSKALDLRGGARMNALAGDVQVNSSAADALYLNGPPQSARLSAHSIHVHGGASYPAGATVPDPLTGEPVVPDYLMYLPDHPDPSAIMPDHGGIFAAGTYNPGRYSLGVDFTDGVANLNPGIYVIGAPGIKLTADAQLQGNEVMLFLDIGAELFIAGQGVAGLDLSAPPSGMYQGIVFYQHRQNTLECDIQGGGLFDLKGTMYLKNALLEMDGNVHREIGRIVVFRQQLRGTGSYTITGLGPPPAGPIYPYLVE